MSKNDSIGANYTKWTANSIFKVFPGRYKKKPRRSNNPRPGIKTPEFQGIPGGIRTLGGYLSSSKVVR